MPQRLTQQQINQITKIINEHMNVLLELTTGKKFDNSRLAKKLKLPKQISDLITDSYKYGKLGILKNKNLKNMSPKDVNELLKAVKLTPAQKQSVSYLKLKAEQNIQSLTSRITTSIVNSALQEQLNVYETILEVIPDALEKNPTDFSKVAREMREKSKDWNRDWDRIAYSEMWDSKLNGEVNAIIDNESPVSQQGMDTRVFKRPAPNACAHCKKHYLEKDGKTPKVFTVSELLANGNNYGKKVADWKPTLGIMHPHCICPLSVLPDGWEFDNMGQLVPKNRGDSK